MFWVEGEGKVTLPKSADLWDVETVAPIHPGNNHEILVDSYMESNVE